MSDDYGNLISAGANLSAGEMGAAYGAYKAYGRVQPFVQGAINAGQGAMLGADIGKVAASGVAKQGSRRPSARQGCRRHRRPYWCHCCGHVSSGRRNLGCCCGNDRWHGHRYLALEQPSAWSPEPWPRSSSRTSPSSVTPSTRSP